MKKIDRIIYIDSILLLVFPTILFLLGFTKNYIAIPTTIITLLLTYRVFKNYEETNYQPNKKYWIIACILIFIWIFFSGIGDFSFQNRDFHFRHAMLRDLIQYNWPVKYDNYGLAYYFSYFLPSALLGKITSYRIANIGLFIYSYICLLHILYFLNRTLKKDSRWALILLIMFSGLDALGIPNKMFTITELEWWNGLFQYSCNTTSLYWVFNQAIPIWLITVMLPHLNNSKNILFISSLAFFYSPFATVGLIPISIYWYLKRTKNLKKDIFSLETIFVLVIMIILGSFYISGNGASQSGFIFQVVKNKHIIIPSYLLLILLEIAMYIIPTYKYYKNNILYKIIVIELLIFPIYVITENNDLCMRGTIAVLFVLMTFVIDYLESKKKKIALLYILLVISFINPAHEIIRSIYYTNTKKDFIADDIVNISNPKAYKKLVEFQFYSNLDSFYYKYISK